MRFSASRRPSLLLLLAGLALFAVALTGAVARTGTAPVAGPRDGSDLVPAAAGARTVIGTKVIGHSVRGRAIRAFHLGVPGEPRVVLMATIHGNEAVPSLILRSLVKHGPIRGLDLWVIPTANPDGFAANDRYNAHGVDLNRNFPRGWIRQTGNYDSGPRPASEPETRALMRFFTWFHPDRVVSFHQPLYGVDRTPKRPMFGRVLSRALRLPLERVGGNTVYHGTFTMWFNHRFKGVAVTVEYGYHPDRSALWNVVPGRLIRALGGRQLS